LAPPFPKVDKIEIKSLIYNICRNQTKIMQSTEMPKQYVVPVGLESFIKANPYPTMEEMECLHMTRIDLDAEYGLLNHSLCKKLYENMYKENCKVYVDKFIEGVKSTGGLQALKCNLETLTHFSPISKITDPELYKVFAEIYKYVDSNFK